jgi:hypothetical protein
VTSLIGDDLDADSAIPTERDVRVGYAMQPNL